MYAANDPRGTRSRAGRIFYNEFQSRFWEEPSKYKEFITKLNIFYICLMLTNFYFLVNDFGKSSSNKDNNNTSRISNIIKGNFCIFIYRFVLELK